MQDADQAGIALVDLGSARQHLQSCSWAPLDEDHFKRHPGLTVLQMAWHPGDTLSEVWHSLGRVESGIALDKRRLQQLHHDIFSNNDPESICTSTAGGPAQSQHEQTATPQSAADTWLSC